MDLQRASNAAVRQKNQSGGKCYFLTDPYWNPATGRREPVPRHNEVPDLLVRKICRMLGIPAPRKE
jgi:hypothetical protein